MDHPIYGGSNRDGWTIRAKKLIEEEHVEAKVVSLDGDALLWYQWELGGDQFGIWEKKKGFLLRELWLSVDGSLHYQRPDEGS